MRYLDLARLRGAQWAPMPPLYRGRQDGYGSKIPTHWLIQLDDLKWRRVYGICWGTGMTCYVRLAGEPVYFATGFESELERLADQNREQTDESAE